MQTLFGLDLPLPYVYVASLAITALLIAIFGFALKRFKTMSGPSGRAGGRNRQPRLGVVDTFSIDRQRQLVIVRRDGAEHLILIGGTSDLLIESNIIRAATGTASLPHDVQQFAERTRSKSASSPEIKQNEHVETRIENEVTALKGDVRQADQSLRGVTDLPPQLRSPLSTARYQVMAKPGGDDGLLAQATFTKARSAEIPERSPAARGRDDDNSSVRSPGDDNTDPRPADSIGHTQIGSPRQTSAVSRTEFTPSMPDLEKDPRSRPGSLEDNLRRLLIRRPTDQG